jgi:SAM-dependent methyltransferase
VTTKASDIARSLLPVGMKRRMKRAVPPRLYRFVDPNWHRGAVGGLWDELGKLQLDFLVSQGLRPEHYLLDVGCGSLRGGVHFIRYLETGRYYGIDRNGERLEAGRTVELPRYGLTEKRPVLERIDDFAVERLGRAFDYAVAQSVFTHIPAEAIELCLRRVAGALVPGGRFYATYNERTVDGPDRLDRSELPYDKDPIFRYDFAALAGLAEGTGLEPERIGDWGHPRGQQMAVFTKP